MRIQSNEGNRNALPGARTNKLLDPTNRPLSPCMQPIATKLPQNIQTTPKEVHYDGTRRAMTHSTYRSRLIGWVSQA
jgi:ATP-dependent DNA ligase